MWKISLWIVIFSLFRVCKVIAERSHWIYLIKSTWCHYLTNLRLFKGWDCKRTVSTEPDVGGLTCSLSHSLLIQVTFNNHYSSTSDGSWFWLRVGKKKVLVTKYRTRPLLCVCPPQNWIQTGLIFLCITATLIQCLCSFTFILLLRIILPLTVQVRVAVLFLNPSTRYYNTWSACSYDPEVRVYYNQCYYSLATPCNYVYFAEFYRFLNHLPVYISRIHFHNLIPCKHNYKCVKVL
jgi:hypothetical protein